MDLLMMAFVVCFLLLLLLFCLCTAATHLGANEHVLINIDDRIHQDLTLPVSPGRWSPHVNVCTRDSITANQRVWLTILTVAQRACLHARVSAARSERSTCTRCLTTATTRRRVSVVSAEACLDLKQWEPVGPPLSKLVSILLFRASLPVSADLIMTVTTWFLPLPSTSHRLPLVWYLDSSARSLVSVTTLYSFTCDDALKASGKSYFSLALGGEPNWACLDSATAEESTSAAAAAASFVCMSSGPAAA